MFVSLVSHGYWEMIKKGDLPPEDSEILLRSVAAGLLEGTGFPAFSLRGWPRWRR